MFIAKDRISICGKCQQLKQIFITTLGIELAAFTEPNYRTTNAYRISIIDRSNCRTIIYPPGGSDVNNKKPGLKPGLPRLMEAKFRTAP
jgi:hypothetical protein